MFLNKYIFYFYKNFLKLNRQNQPLIYMFLVA